MFKKISISMALLACLAFSAGAFAAADPSLHDVYQAAQAGRVNEAQDMMKQVLRDHPESGKAHYVVAELDAKQGKTAAAAEELANAERLAPGLPFAKPESVQALRSVIARGNTANNSRPATVNQAPVAAGNSQLAPAGGLPWGGILIGIIVILAGFMLFRRMMRRQQQVMMPAPMYGGGPGGGVQGFGQGPGYGPNGPAGPAPGYGPNYGPAAQQPGMGSGLMGSLATGAAMGAGVVAGQALMHRFTDGGRNENNGNNGSNAPVDNSSWNAPADNNMGGTDFGIADNSSWDSGSGGGDSGGGGGNDDWS